MAVALAQAVAVSAVRAVDLGEKVTQSYDAKGSFNFASFFKSSLLVILYL